MVTLNPSILGLAMDNIRGRIADLRELGFNDPVKMVTSRPAILGYARERVLICGRIVMRLEERTDDMLGRLIKESRAVIDANSHCPAANLVRCLRRHRHGEERYREGEHRPAHRREA
jgi:hypothetical protein